MVVIYKDIAYPMVWSRQEGKGRVAHIALGHSKEVWKLKSFKRLMLQTIGWLIS